MIRLTILGEPASKANSREIVMVGKGENRRAMVRKSDKALAYEANALRQIPPAARQRLEGPLRMTLRIWYATERPDLDESLILDVLQDRYTTQTYGDEKKRELVQYGVYRNDRQVRERHVFHAIDKGNPRTEIVVEPIPEAQEMLPLAIEEHPDVALLRELVDSFADGCHDSISNRAEAEQFDGDKVKAAAALDRINAALCGLTP